MEGKIIWNSFPSSWFRSKISSHQKSYQLFEEIRPQWKSCDTAFTNQKEVLCAARLRLTHVCAPLQAAGAPP